MRSPLRRLPASARSVSTTGTLTFVDVFVGDSSTGGLQGQFTVH